MLTAGDRSIQPLLVVKTCNLARVRLMLHRAVYATMTRSSICTASAGDGQCRHDRNARLILLSVHTHSGKLELCLLPLARASRYYGHQRDARLTVLCVHIQTKSASAAAGDSC